MKLDELIGTKKSISCELTERHSAITVGSGDVPVLGTPAMLALMEQASVQLVAPAMSEGESTVGVRVEVDHLRATGLGHVVTATATLTSVDGRKLCFDLEVQDEKGVIGKGHLERFLITKDRFLSKLA